MSDSTATKKPNPPEANYKETVESILVAFILAFIFRAFVVEAFVIPTGSMAPTLYGAHIRYRCPDCGYVFDVGFKGTSNAADDDVEIPSDGIPATSYHCPNCGYQFSTDRQPVRFGDRILVLKYLYLFQQPRRWDVVVFKSPDEPQHHDAEDPEYATNYIKRLIAIGPESVVLLDGDVYIGPKDANQPLGSDGKPLFKIQRKPAYAQDALWRVICDNDFVPHLGQGVHAWTQPWTEETPPSGWKLSGPATPTWRDGTPSRNFDFANAQGGGAITFNPEANPDTHGLSDFLVYDESEHHDLRNGWEPTYVSDLKLSCFYTRTSGDGPFRLQLSRNDDLFTAEIKGGKVRLLMSKRVSADRPDAVTNEHAVGESLEPVAIAALNGSEPVHVELRNVDYRVSVRINDKEIIATTDEQYAPDVKQLWDHEEEQFRGGRAVELPFGKPLVRIDAHNQTARIEHVVLARDVYYLSFHLGQKFWATTQRVSHLKAGEYFVMGDNTFISGDARYWQDRIELPHEGLDVDSGRVPAQFMLGKAFFVYWPAGYRLPYLPVNGVPDFGEMRFIR